MDKTQLWGSEVIEHPSGTTASMYTTNHGDAYSGVYSLTFLIILLVVFKFIKRSMAVILSCCFRFSQAWKSREDVSLETSRVILFLVSLLHFSILGFFFIRIYRPELLENLGWLMIPALGVAFYLLYICKWGLLVYVGWLIRLPNELRFLAQSPRDFVILAAILSLPLSLLNLFPIIPNADYLLIWCVAALSISFLLFIVRSFYFFLHLRFSVFFWILYLCSLEIAPLALLYRMGLII
ncbi:MAG: DUF4271 domain-containing protein [Bacteroidales bacterium]|nr:DUF4271 domain-containing protein [Bacteroidales bacterium]